MKYENARDVLPPELLAELQKYAAGKLLYVPGTGSRRPWGEKTGCRQQIEQRNREIRRKFEAGVPVEELAEMYFLAAETIKNLVYGRKESNPMEFSEIFALYDEREPLRYEVVYVDDRTAEWGDVYFLKDLDVTFQKPGRRMLIHVYQYVYATPERIAEQARLIEAYNSLGYRCAKILPNRFGELSRNVDFEGHPCLVYAEELPVIAVEEKNAVRRDEFGELCWHRDALVCLAKIAAMHLDGKEVGCCTMFDGADGQRGMTAAYGYEDWIEEYLELDLKNRIENAYPALTEKYAEVRGGMREIRDELRKIWPELPTSLFHPGVSHSGIILDENELLIGLREFVDGGRDACLNAFLNTLGSFNEQFPENFALAVLGDPSLRQKRAEGVERGLRLIGQYYRFTEREIEAAPLVWLNLQFGGIWYWNDTLFGEGKDEADVSAMLDDMLRLISLRGNEIDFAAAMRTSGT